MELVEQANVADLELGALGLAAEQEFIGRDLEDRGDDTLRASPAAREYLRKRGIEDDEAIAHFQLGYGDRSLSLRLPYKQRKAGEEMRSRLTKLGVLRSRNTSTSTAVW